MLYILLDWRILLFGILVSSQMRIDVRSLWRYLVQRSLFHSHSVSEEQTCLVHYNGIKKSMNFLICCKDRGLQK